MSSELVQRRYETKKNNYELLRHSGNDNSIKEHNDGAFYINNSKPQSMPKTLHPRSGGIGLVNVRRRLDLLYPNRYSLEIEDAPDSYGVQLKISLV